ncbi:hypothetical protein D3C86_1734720 [compost metagenome]
MLALENSANTHVAMAQTTMVTRMANKNCLSFMSGRKRLSTFSVKVTDGASKVPEAVDMIADSSAPKNMTWANKGVRSRIRCGRIICASSVSKRWTISGSIIEAA